MSNYYEYRDVKVMIYHKLTEMGWTCYGYKPNESDPMTDYYSPEDWDGIAEKNGYILVIDHKYASEAKKDWRYNSLQKENDDVRIDHKTQLKIEKLSKITLANGSAPSEVEFAQKTILKLTSKKSNVSTINYEERMIPAHLANPLRSNWHLERNGIIIDKGTGLLKYVCLYHYYSYQRDKEELDNFINNPNMYPDGYTKNRLTNMAKQKSSFEKFIQRIDNEAGGLVGNDKVKAEIVTEYKVKRVAVDSDSSTEYIKLTNYYGVWHVNETIMSDYYKLVKMNSALKSELKDNYLNTKYIRKSNMNRYIEKKALTYVNIVEQKIPYTVEKMVKVKKSV